MERTKCVWMDGEIVPWDDAQVHVLSYGLHYGIGFFEGLRSYETDRGPAVFRLTDHIKRLQRSARVYLVTLQYSTEQLVEGVKAVVRENGLDECYIRPITWLGFGATPISAPWHTAITCWRWSYFGEEVGDGVSAKVSSFRRVGSSALPPAAKATGQYLSAYLARAEAICGGYQEAILLNEAGYVTDGSAENLFAVTDGVISTPPTSAGALSGITRDSIVELARGLGYEVREENLVRSDLYLADELFFTGTAAEVVPILRVDDRVVCDGIPGPVTKELGQLFSDVVHGRSPAHSHWLEYVLD